MNKEGLIIFAKNPVVGRVKTRLAKDIGDEHALEVYRGLIKFTRTVTDRFTETKYVFYDDHIDHEDEWIADNYSKDVQAGVDLGERMKNAFNTLFKNGFDKLVLIGTDCIDLRLDILQMAFRKLDQCDVTIGPARDGGYYLIGMKEPLPFLFERINWSTGTVFTETTKILNENFKTHFELPVLKDLDTKDDLLEFMKYQTQFKYQ